MRLHAWLRFASVLLLTGFHAAQAQAPALKLDHSASGLRFGLNVRPGWNYTLHGTSDLGAPDSWKPLMRFSPTNDVLTWLEASAPGRRFFRVEESEDPGDNYVYDFLLVDHQGVGRQLFHESQAPAVVLFFAGDNPANLVPLSPAIKALQATFEKQGVRLWAVCSTPDTNRAGVTAMATSAGLTLPVLHDPLGIVQRNFGVTTVPEAVCIEPSSWSVAYRGVVEQAGQTFLADALNALLSAASPLVRQSESTGQPVPPDTAGPVSYATQVAPLLRAKCVECHSPGNIAPWSMTNHAVVALYAESIKNEILARRMPPWGADYQYGSFANDHSLTPSETAMLIRWVDAGAPRGSGEDLLVTSPAPQTEFPNAWPSDLGTPDLVLKIPSQKIAAKGVMQYIYVPLQTSLPTNAWLRAAVVKPGNKKVVHHALVFLAKNTLDLLLNSQGGLAGYYAGYVPGMKPVTYPEGTGKLLPKGAPLLFQMHYTTIGEATTDQTEIGFYFSKTVPALELKTGGAYDVGFTIPPYAVDSETQATFTFAKSALLYEFSPHMHLRGSRFKYELVLPGGQRETILSVPKYSFDWQTLYRLATPLRVPAGATIVCTGAFDNSLENHHNPDPSQTVRFGEQTFNEMFIGYLNYAEVP